MKPVSIIYVPYDGGRKGERFGQGPIKAMESGFVSRLKATIDASECAIALDGTFISECAAAFDLARKISRAVAEALAKGAFPLVVAGNCVSSLGTVSGMGGARRGVVWLDAHPDFSTPDTSLTGYFDGMGTSILVGEAWRAAANTVGNFRPINRIDLLFLGVREIDADEAARLQEPRVSVFSDGDLRMHKPIVESSLRALAENCDTIYLHFDLDVTRSTPVPANEFAPEGGLNDEEVIELFQAIADHARPTAAGITAYDPGLDSDGSMMKRYLKIIEMLAGLGAGT